MKSRMKSSMVPTAKRSTASTNLKMAATNSNATGKSTWVSTASIISQGCYIKAIDDGGFRYSIWVEEGVLYVHKPSGVTPRPVPPLPRKQYALQIRRFYSNDGISFYHDTLHRHQVYTDIKEANEEARFMALEEAALDDDDERLEELLEERNVSSSTKLYQGNIQLSPFFYNDPVSATIRVVELRPEAAPQASEARPVPQIMEGQRDSKRPRNI